MSRNTPRIPARAAGANSDSGFMPRHRNALDGLADMRGRGIALALREMQAALGPAPQDVFRIARPFLAHQVFDFARAKLVGPASEQRLEIVQRCRVSQYAGAARAVARKYLRDKITGQFRVTALESAHGARRITKVAAWQRRAIGPLRSQGPHRKA